MKPVNKIRRTQQSLATLAMIQAFQAVAGASRMPRLSGPSVLQALRAKYIYHDSVCRCKKCLAVRSQGLNQRYRQAWGPDSINAYSELLKLVHKAWAQPVVSYTELYETEAFKAAKVFYSDIHRWTLSAKQQATCSIHFE